MRYSRLPITLLILALPGGWAWGNPTSFTLSKDAALKLGAVEWSDAVWPGGFNVFAPVTDDRWIYQSSGLMQGQVGFYGMLDDTNADSRAWVRIGASGYPGGVDAVIGTHDLSGYASYDLFVANDDDDIWMVKLYVRTSSSYLESDVWTTVGPGGSIVGSLELTGLAGLSAVTDIGLIVGNHLTGLDGNPSDPDVFHISTTPVPVPAPGAMALTMLGMGLLAGWRRRE